MRFCKRKEEEEDCWSLNNEARDGWNSYINLNALRVQTEEVRQIKLIVNRLV